MVFSNGRVLRFSRISASFVTFLLLSGGFGHSSIAAGLILVNDYPQEEIRDVVPFTSERIRSANESAYQRYFVDREGKAIRIDTRFIAEVVTFPVADEFPNVTSESTVARLASKKAELDGVAARVPKTKAHVAAPLAMLSSEIKRYRAGERKVKGQWLSADDYAKLRLVLSGVQYENVELISTGEVSATFQQGDQRKALQVRLEQLTPEQIKLLNETTRSVQIDINWRETAEEAARQRALAEQRRREELARIQAEKRQLALNEASNLEKAARYDEALVLYRQAGAEDEIRRVSRSLAVGAESKGKFATAADYFEAAGAFEEAGRIRRTHDLTQASSREKLTDAQIFKRALPAVVAVAVTDSRGEKAHGSGFFVRKGGYLITNNHVIRDALTIRVIDAEGKQHSARVIARSETPDLALLQADVANHAVCPLGDPIQAQPGDHIVAIGFPIFDQWSATMNQGVISSVDRRVRNNDVFQIDATINHGNSGGPLFNDRGEVIGVPTFSLADFGVDRFNFALKISEARSLMEKIQTVATK